MYLKTGMWKYAMSTLFSLLHTIFQKNCLCHEEIDHQVVYFARRLNFAKKKHKKIKTNEICGNVCLSDNSLKLNNT